MGRPMPVSRSTALLSGARRVATWTLAVGATCFAAGFFGPMIFAPGSNQGPLLGILITGPLGIVAGFAIGVVRELFGFTAGPVQVLARTGVLDIDPRTALRTAAAVGGLVLAASGLAGLGRGGGRGDAAAIVVAAALLWYAASGRVPTWFRR